MGWLCTVKGLVTSKSGKVLHDLYDRFGINMPKEVALGLAGSVSGLASKIKNEIVLSVEEELDEAYTGIRAFCGSNFHSKLWDQKEVRETFLYNSGAAQLRADVPDEFSFAGIIWERYRTGKKASKENGGSAYIESDEARIVPVGVSELFITRF